MTRETPQGRVAALSDFQRATAQHAFRRLYLDEDSSRRFLVADETGLGKTHVAKEVIALTLDHLQRVDHVKRIDIVYVCSNADIARQNIRKLTISGSESPSFATRLSLLITQPDVLTPAPGKGKPATFVAFTPATSFQFGLQMGDGTGARRALRAAARSPGTPGGTGDGGGADLPGRCDQSAQIHRLVRRVRARTALRAQHPPDVP